MFRILYLYVYKSYIQIMNLKAFPELSHPLKKATKTFIIAQNPILSEKSVKWSHILVLNRLTGRHSVRESNITLRWHDGAKCDDTKVCNIRTMLVGLTEMNWGRGGLSEEEEERRMHPPIHRWLQCTPPILCS